MDDRHYRSRRALTQAQEDLAARRAALGQVRMLEDPDFRARYGRYLRREIEWREVLAGETHEEWYARRAEG